MKIDKLISAILIMIFWFSGTSQQATAQQPVSCSNKTGDRVDYYSGIFKLMRGTQN
jgi:hypothetical protein